MPQPGILGGMRQRVLAAAVAATILTGACTSASSSTSADGERRDAFRVCQGFVKAKLKAPATAQFRSFDLVPIFTNPGPSSYSVVSTVDSQNSFGADLRSNFTCKVHLDGSSWALDDLQIT